MKLLSMLTIVLLLFVMSPVGQAADRDLQGDLLKAKLKPLLKAEKYSEALPYMAELERLGPSLSEPLPESFYYFYIDCLDKTGDKTNALSRANTYIKKYGRTGKFYSRVLEILGSLQIQADNERKYAEEFVLIRGGCYQMGDTFGDGVRDEKPVHQACVDDFYIGKYEVTQGQWQAVMGNNPSNFSSCGDNCPVEKVSWNDVQDFIGRLNSKAGGNKYRLPTEAEWEYAARSGGKNEKYSGSDNIDSVAWYKSNSGKTTHPVGQKQPNGLGLYDMSGNVWEWVQDWYGSYSGGLQNNPNGPSSGSSRVYRGGSWYDGAGVVSATFRAYYTSDRLFNLGFRLARTR